MGLLPRRPQDGFPTWPGGLRLVRMEQEGLLVHKPDQVGGVQIPLHLEAARRTSMHPLRQRFLLDSTTLAGLRQFRPSRGNGENLAASTRSQTGQDLYERPWGTPLDRPAKTALPRAVGDLFEEKGLALVYDLMGQPAMQALAVRRQPALPIGELGLGPPLPPRCPPVSASRVPRLHRAIGRIIVWVVGAALPIQVPLLPPDLGYLRIQLGTQLLQLGVRVCDHCHRRGTQIQPYRALTEYMVGLLIGSAFTDELDPEAGPPAYLAPDQPHVFHPGGQPMRQHRIPLGMVVRQVGPQGEPAPHHPVTAPDQPSLVALALDGVQLLRALEPHPPGLAQRHPQHCPVGAGG